MCGVYAELRLKLKLAALLFILEAGTPAHTNSHTEKEREKQKLNSIWTLPETRQFI